MIVLINKGEVAMTTPKGSQNGIHPGANSAFVTHLECSKTGEHYPKDTLYGMSPAGAPLIIEVSNENMICLPKTYKRS